MNQDLIPRLILPSDCLTAAEQINLRDMLESASCQSWVVSALGNQERFINCFAGTDTQSEEFLQYRLHAVNYRIPFAIRQRLYRTTSTLIANTKKERLRLERQ